MHSCAIQSHVIPESAETVTSFRRYLEDLQHEYSDVGKIKAGIINVGKIKDGIFSAGACIINADTFDVGKIEEGSCDAGIIYIGIIEAAVEIAADSYE